MLGTFCTMPAIWNPWRNFLSEFIATCLLVFLILAIGTQGNAFQLGPVSASTGAIGAWPVTCVIMALGMSLGGTTGYAMNPARDLFSFMKEILVASMALEAYLHISADLLSMTRMSAPDLVKGS